MQIKSSLTIATMVLLLQIKEAITSSILHPYSKCECEQLLFENECNLNIQCSFLNNKCISKPCSQLLDNNQCILNMKCGWDQNQCSEFKSCTKFTQPNDCTHYNYQCQYDYMTNTCNTYDKVYQKTCSETSPFNCSKAKDGLCQQSNGKCEKINDCKDVKKDKWGNCTYFDYCQPNNVTKKCEPRIDCKHNVSSDCFLVPTDMVSTSYFICQQGEGASCEDWNIQAETLKTCHSYSLRYYHWTGTACESCSSKSSFEIQ